jgi:tetratricopeptide (TPR) repeat protein
LTRRPNNKYQTQRFITRKIGRDSNKYRRPFWLPASSYYILATAIAIAFFFFLWGILHEGGEDMPWITAGIGASILLVGAVVLREIILRRARNNFLSAQQRLDNNLKKVAPQVSANSDANKLTVQQNAGIIKDIQKKSEAAKVLGKLSEGHLEVFEMCREYLAVNKNQLETVGLGSPRLAALRRGREIVQDLHYFHLLAWAELESRLFTQEAKNRAIISEKLEMSQKALTVLDFALQFYPNEPQLVESNEVLKEFAASIKISHLIEKAERAAFKSNYKLAINHYRDALFFLARENAGREEKEIIAEKINSEIEKIRELSADEKKKIAPKKSVRKRKND